MKRTFVLVHALARQRAAEYAVREAPDGAVAVFQQAPKSRPQEAMYHALIDDIARQYTHAGRKWEAEDMKRLLVAAFKHDTKDDADLAPLWREMGEIELAPAIAGGGFVLLGTQTKKFPRKLATAFIEWLNAFAAENGIELAEPRERQAA